jgi:hypothetical protein
MGESPMQVNVDNSGKIYGITEKFWHRTVYNKGLL